MTSTARDSGSSYAGSDRPGRGTVPRPVTVAAPDEPELIRQGLTALLEPFASRVRLLDTSTPPAAGSADVVLYDCFPEVGRGKASGHLPELMGAATVAYSWETRPESVAWALHHGFAGYLSKALPGEELASAVEAVHAGEVVVHPVARHPIAGSPIDRATSVQHAGLTPREAEVLSLVCRGLSNRQISEAMFLSPNSLKSYIRAAYRKIEVRTRSQAVLWGIQNGFRPPS
jgi:DNA-binding NarL/FixJ family response regulator